MELTDTLLDSFRINNRINLYLLAAVPADHLKDQAGGKGRTVAEQFAHIHTVRGMWLKAAAPALAEGFEQPDKSALDNVCLNRLLLASGIAVEELLKQGFHENRIKGFKPHPAAFLAYLISHESHHRGQIVLGLKLCGHPVEKKILFGMWEWGTR